MSTQDYIEEPDNERGQSDTISVKEELRECFGKFGEIGDVYMDGRKTSGSGSQVSMSTQANVGDGMQSSSVLRGLQWSLTDSSGIMRLVVDNPVGVQRETVEMMTARVQTDENDDAGVRPVMTALLRTSTEMPDEQAETGFLDGASLAHRLSDNECGQGELDSPEIGRSVVDRSVGVQCKTVELKTVGAQTDENEDACARPVMLAPLRLSTEIPDEAVWGTLTPTTGATAAERRVFDGAGTDPPQSGSSGSEREIRAGPTVLTHHADSSLEAQCQCPAVGHETGYDEDVTVITHQVGSSFEAEHEARYDGDVHPKGTDGPLETTHTDEAASSESSEATVEPGQEASDREDSESGALYTPELDIVFDALVELAGDGRCWVPVRQIQAQTSLRLWRLEELLEEWECMGAICRDDTRRNVAFGSSVADALEDEY